MFTLYDNKMKIDLRSLSFNLTGQYEYVTDPPYLADNGTFAIEY